MTFHGNRGTVTSRGRSPDQSMMLIPSIMELLDGLGPFLSKPRSTSHQFDGFDCSFHVSFCKGHGKVKSRQIFVTSYGELIHVGDKQSLKTDVLQSVSDFIQAHNLAQMMNEDEAGEFHDSWKRFNEFTP